MTTFEKARAFIYRNARPLELSKWQYHFENGSKEAVLNALSFYQNEDGGFGNGLEADNLNPNSSPMATWAATETLREIELTDKEHPIVKGILRYLESGEHFDEKQNKWLNTIPSNNDHPHAIWWEYNENSDSTSYNPTAALAAFIITYADKRTAIYEKGSKIAREAVEWFVSSAPINDNHDIACFIRLYDAVECVEIISKDMLEHFRTGLRESVKLTICPDTEKWAVEYVTRPSDYSITPDSMFYQDNAEIALYEHDFIQTIQRADGGFDVPWKWWTDYIEFHVSEHRWQSILTIKYMLYLKGYENKTA